MTMPICRNGTLPCASEALVERACPCQCHTSRPPAEALRRCACRLKRGDTKLTCCSGIGAKGWCVQVGEQAAKQQSCGCSHPGWCVQPAVCSPPASRPGLCCARSPCDMWAIATCGSGTRPESPGPRAVIVLRRRGPQGSSLKPAALGDCGAPRHGRLCHLLCSFSPLLFPPP
jgi:hypothetical protein